MCGMETGTVSAICVFSGQGAVCSDTGFWYVMLSSIKATFPLKSFNISILEYSTMSKNLNPFTSRCTSKKKKTSTYIKSPQMSLTIERWIAWQPSRRSGFLWFRKHHSRVKQIVLFIKCHSIPRLVIHSCSIHGLKRCPYNQKTPWVATYKSCLLVLLWK